MLSLVMAEMCSQLVKGGQDAAENLKEVLLAEPFDDEKNVKKFNNVNVLKMTAKFSSKFAEFLCVCIASRAQITVIGKQQAEAYCS